MVVVGRVVISVKSIARDESFEKRKIIYFLCVFPSLFPAVITTTPNVVAATSVVYQTRSSLLSMYASKYLGVSRVCYRVSVCAKDETVLRKSWQFQGERAT